MMWHDYMPPPPAMYPPGMHYGPGRNDILGSNIQILPSMLPMNMFVPNWNCTMTDSSVKLLFRSCSESRLLSTPKFHKVPLSCRNGSWVASRTPSCTWKPMPTPPAAGAVVRRWMGASLHWPRTAHGCGRWSRKGISLLRKLWPANVWQQPRSMQKSVDRPIGKIWPYTTKATGFLPQNRVVSICRWANGWTCHAWELWSLLQCVVWPMSGRKHLVVVITQDCQTSNVKSQYGVRELVESWAILISSNSHKNLQERRHDCKDSDPKFWLLVVLLHNGAKFKMVLQRFAKRSFLVHTSEPL